MRRSQITLSGIAAATVVLSGCGGSGVAGGATPTGKPAYRAVTLSGYQTQVAATKYVLPLLTAGAPGGSGLHFYAMLRPGLGAKRLGSQGLNYDPDLGLYFSTGTSGPTWTMSFFTDAAGTHSAGSASVTIENVSTFSTNYLTYPATLDMSMNITAGNLVSSGTGKLVFTDSSGANTLTGSLNVPSKGIQASLNMSLDSTLHVGGSLTVTQNGLTAVVTQLAGTVTTSFTGHAAVSPGNLTGTATINLLQGTYQLSIDNGNGLTASGSVDASHNLTINYNDNTWLSLGNAINQPVLGPGSNGSGSSSSYTITPVNGNPASINAVSPDGKMVGQIGAHNPTLPYYWSSPSATAQAVTGDSGLTNVTVTGVNASGHLAGYGLDASTGLAVALYWSAFNQAPVHLTTPTTDGAPFFTPSVFLSSSDRVVVTYPIHSSPGSASFVFNGPSDSAPYAVAGGYITGMSDGVAAAGVDAGNRFAVWPSISPSATPTPIPAPSGKSPTVMAIGADGTIGCADTNNHAAWVVKGPGYSTTTSLQSPVANQAIVVLGFGPTDHALGYAVTDNTSLDDEGLIWSTSASTPVILRTSGTPNVLSANFETNSGVLIVNGIDNPSGPTYRFSYMTPK